MLNNTSYKRGTKETHTYKSNGRLITNLLISLLTICTLAFISFFSQNTELYNYQLCID